MKVKIQNTKKIFDSNQNVLLLNFIKFLQDEVHLKDDVVVNFTLERIGDMTTGVRKKHGYIIVYCKDRLLIDVLRTLSHEWTHEYQDQTGYTKKHKHKDIGGTIENMANSLSGLLIKKFQKEYPEYETLMYGEK